MLDVLTHFQNWLFVIDNRLGGPTIDSFSGTCYAWAVSERWDSEGRSSSCMPDVCPMDRTPTKVGTTAIKHTIVARAISATVVQERMAVA